ncbi:AMP-dependent synthetase/ligase [Arsenicicoccus piscis]|uniref:Acyl-CoA synthetase n=1 Tax=Arsenicicoccus piscis TaxID=673954 RepID=A0ABQ6HMQ6_9MICO|nr:AMP-dependent synthetase/ligase [Arsenicicoccus piscis]MCH8628653.1 AMP-dependent synthetase/ligase [Arsenicicoccus piscis]GMA19415.1 long-chain-fatty-acid--CoA ligase [Arsenicicoccus piscis]
MPTTLTEFATPILVAQPSSPNLGDLPFRNAARHPDLVAFGRRVPGSDDGPAQWEDVTASEFAADVSAVAKGLIASGLEVGDRIGLLSRTCYEWTVLDFAIWAAGGVGVPIYETSSADQIAWILDDSGARALFTETTRHADTVAGIRDRLPHLEHVWTIDGDGLDDLRTAGEAVSAADLDERRAVPTLDDLATLIYTSGTTGRPKGCEITHGNFLLLSANVIDRLTDVVADGSATLLFLPLAHVFARLIEVVAFDAGVRIGHAPDVKNLMSDLEGFQPTFLLAVPRVLEKVYNLTEAKAASGGRGKIFNAAARVAISHSRTTATGATPPLKLRLTHALYDRLVYSKLRAALGGQVKYVVSGGAPLGARLGHFYRGVGMLVLEGYGLTETTAPLSVNTPELIKIGTVGLPLPGVGVKIADDGEILVQGINVFRGYWGNDEATREALSDGWFHTGDIGALDEDGYISITGRKKELIVTAGGKNVAPAVLEDRLRASALVSQCLVVGDHRPFIGALVTLDEEMWPTWSANHGVTCSFAEAKDDETVQKALQDAVDFANEAVSRAESIRKFVVLDTDFTEANGYLTPSFKVKRHAVLKDQKAVIDDLYGGPLESDD